MIHVCQDDNAPIGRPPVVRDAVLACLQRLKRASTARLIEETGIGANSVRQAMRRAYEMEEVKRETRIADNGPYYIWEVRGE